MQRRINPALFFGDPTIHAADPEPSLDELLRDPVLQGLLRSDGISRNDILTLAAITRQRLNGGAHAGRGA
jgi:hypothetical protein